MIMMVLKESTRAMHERIEAHVNLPGRLHSLHDYRQLLERLYGFYEPLETRLAALTAGSDDGNFMRRWKAAYLMRDLAALGLSPERIVALPRCADLPQIDNRAQVFGSFYVLEGATLGGQAIARQLKHRFNFDAQFGAAFFNGDSADTGARWQSFSAAVTDLATTPETEEAIIHSASATFQAFDRWLATQSS